MGGKAKIEGLTNSWYGFAVFSAVCGVLRDFGILSIVFGVAGLLFSWFVTFIIGRALINRSSLTRLFLILVSSLCSLFGVLAVGAAAWGFLQTWKLGLIAGGGYAAVSAWMHVKSLFTLMDRSVKAYVG
ncbi:MAG TPA: hypothetical protein VM925_33645 [Labilithrix sp.]|nr:hypothetical protein [Labilithrix sp.]